MEYFTGKTQSELQDYGNTDNEQSGFLVLFFFKYLNVRFHLFMAAQ